MEGAGDFLKEDFPVKNFGGTGIQTPPSDVLLILAKIRAT